MVTAEQFVSVCFRAVPWLNCRYWAELLRFRVQGIPRLDVKGANRLVHGEISRETKRFDQLDDVRFVFDASIGVGRPAVEFQGEQLGEWHVLGKIRYNRGDGKRHVAGPLVTTSTGKEVN
jgi:hypothetical protein